MTPQQPSALWLEVAELVQEIEARLNAEANRADAAETTAMPERASDEAA